jgi:hypothetical protein
MTYEQPSDVTLREAAEKILISSGYETRWEEITLQGEARPTRLLRVAVPNGRYTRWNAVSDRRAQSIVELKAVPPAAALGDYEAVLYRDTKEVEATVRSLDAMRSPSWAESLMKIPGAQVTRAEGVSISRSTRNTEWRLPFAAGAGQNWSAEIGTESDKYTLFKTRVASYAGKEVTLKIRGAITSQHHDDAIQVLDMVSQAILFELDLRYGITLSVGKVSVFELARRTDKDGKTNQLPRTRREVSNEQPSLPRSSYPERPLALYWYARLAGNMPLLQFLASYQVLEYHFSAYYQREVLDRMRQELLDPRFSPQSDRDLGRLVSLAKAQSKGFGTERDQLRSTVRGCTSSSSIEEYLNEASRREFFTGKQVIAGLPRIDLNKSSADLRDQVSDRIYDIRCRIVHAKSEPQDQYPDLILPFSPEASSLTFDIDLIQYLAQRVLINHAQPMRLP